MRPLISGRQIFLYVPASNFVLPPRSSLPLHILPQGSRGFYVRAERASLPPHAPGMLTVRIQAIDGTRTFTSLDPRPCRPLPPCPAAVQWQLCSFPSKTLSPRQLDAW